MEVWELLEETASPASLEGAWGEGNTAGTAWESLCKTSPEDRQWYKGNLFLFSSLERNHRLLSSLVSAKFSTSLSTVSQSFVRRWENGLSICLFLIDLHKLCKPSFVCLSTVLLPSTYMENESRPQTSESCICSHPALTCLLLPWEGKENHQASSKPDTRRK